MASTYASYSLTVGLIVLAGFGGVEYVLGGQPFTVVSDSPSSMSSTINYGDVTVNYLASFSTLRVGDIVVFHDPRGNPVIVTHRVVGISSCAGEVCLSTKGDNDATNPDPDPWNVTTRNYVGKVVLIVPYLGFISPAMWGFVGALGILPIGFVLLLAAFVGLRKSHASENDAGISADGGGGREW